MFSYSLRYNKCTFILSTKALQPMRVFKNQERLGYALSPVHSYDGVEKKSVYTCETIQLSGITKQQSKTQEQYLAAELSESV